MSDNTSNEQSSSPEERIIRELYRTKEGGLAPGSRGREYGRVFETLLRRELQRLAQNQTDADIRFARGYVVDDYGTSNYHGASAADADTVDYSSSPRFDLICYDGEVAWTSHDGLPCALVPTSFVYGGIEAKRTLSPGYFPIDSSRSINAQLRRQREHLDALDVRGPLIVVGAHYSGDPAEIRQQAAADEVILLGDLANKGSAAEMAERRALARTVRLLSS